MPTSVKADDGITWLYNGYNWTDGYTPGLPDYSSQFLDYPELSQGKAVFYGPYAMNGTARYRGMSLDGYYGGVALLTCGDLGKSVWIKRPDHNFEGPFLVVDCARRNDLYGITVHREEVVEVDFNTALKWGMVTYDKATYNWGVKKWLIRDVIVSRANPDGLCGNEPVELFKNWFLKNVTYSKNHIQDYEEYRSIQLPNIKESYENYLRDREINVDKKVIICSIQQTIPISFNCIP